MLSKRVLCLRGIYFEVQVGGAACKKQVLRYALDNKNLKGGDVFP
jgi:hypothetical protein